MNNRHIYYISTFIPRDIKSKISGRMKNFNFNSADAFSYSVFDGLRKNLNHNFKCINVAPVGAFPRFNRNAKFSHHQSSENGILVDSIGFSTIYGYMYYSIYKNLLDSLINLPYKDDLSVFIVYSINIPVLKALIKYKTKYNNNIIIILIIPDQIEDFDCNTLPAKIKSKLFGNIQDIYAHVDGFVLLTEQMNDRISVKRPYCIVEGIYNDSEERISISASQKRKDILYTGMLYEKFGVKDLIDAFIKVPDMDARLLLCGCGELEDYIREVQMKDKRIKYLGLVNREDALKLQSEAYLLVNPRKPGQEFTKYSFPSKNIEYLVSGTPVLLYELPGIPSEYYDYCYHISHDKTSIEDIAFAIEEILSCPQDMLDKLSSKASHFIKSKKNSKIQTAKILNLIDIICSHS